MCTWVDAVIGPLLHSVDFRRSDCCAIRAAYLTEVVAAIEQLLGLMILVPFDQSEKQRGGLLYDSSNWPIYSAKP